MTRSTPPPPSNEFIDPVPSIIPCNIEIAHHQLRDLLQPAAEKGKVLFVNRLKLDSVDFATKKPPTTFCTLEFTAVCLTTGSGLVAAGGQQSELEIRPLLFSPTTSSHEIDGNSTLMATNSSNGASTTEMRREASTSRHQPSPRWHLRTPTGGSINNSICIQPDVVLRSTNVQQVSGLGMMSDADGKDACKHREKRRREIDDGNGDINEMHSAWMRDDPIGRFDAVRTPTTSSKNALEISMKGMEAMLDGNRLGDEASEEEKLRRREEKRRCNKTEVYRNGFLNSSDRSHQHLQPVSGTVRILVSNNDQSVKEFRLRPPTRRYGNSGTNAGGSNGNSNGGDEEKLDTRWYGLSRLQTVEFPTCINHSSFSPSGRHLVCVGDTPDVFLYSVDPISGDLSKICTYTASSDASFSTAWSPDGLRFAVASQDGFITIWDVRSASKIASLKTSQTTSDVRQSGSARAVKWSPRGDLLAYTEHTNYFHVVETETFTISQRIRVPPAGSGRSQENAQCSQEESVTEGQSNGNDRGNGETDDSSANHALLESTSPSRYTTIARNTTASNAANTSRSWSNARRYRDIGNSGNMRSPLDRALISDSWSNTRRGGSNGNNSTSIAEVYIDNGPSRGSQDVPTTTTNATSSRFDNSSNVAANRGDTADPSTSMLFRTVDSIMATFENEVGVQRGSNLWSMGGVSRRTHRSEEGVDISGMTWDPDGEYLYVSTLDVVAQYSVQDLRRSFGCAAIR